MLQSTYFSRNPFCAGLIVLNGDMLPVQHLIVMSQSKLKRQFEIVEKPLILSLKLYTFVSYFHRNAECKRCTGALENRLILSCSQAEGNNYGHYKVRQFFGKS